ncbi:MAG: hypothetical protein JHC81_04270 [Brevundimonas sp.]|uniref:hypothetical protein n=1 Tax=Brevundimonas sp. TaxID=1871086 RepID=UPI001A1BBE46|nr:hypothetical protein [Brevundimonas sp.]MBJ7446729.1 hypothetical protein [Brevundimonas sp.]
MAYTEFSNGLALGFRCMDGDFSAVVSGLPASQTERRTLRVKFGDDDTDDTFWTTTTEPSVAVADMPAPLARMFRRGGSLRLTVPRANSAGQDVTYAVDLPQSSVAIDETLTRCGKPLTDPRDVELNALADGGLPMNLNWETRPRLDFPRTDYARGFAVVSCIADQSGRARDCVVESEHPHDGRFGRATLDGMNNARLTNLAQPGAPLRPSRFVFRAIFTVDGYQTDEERRATSDDRRYVPTRRTSR